MGGIWISRNELITTTSELVGHKSGLALTREELRHHAPPEYQSIWEGNDDSLIRIRSEEFEELFTSILYRLGNISTPKNLPPMLSLTLRYKNDPHMLTTLTGVLKLTSLLTESMDAADSSKGECVDPSPFLSAAREEYGLDGMMVAIAICEAINDELHHSPWGLVRRQKWSDTADLTGLFDSESLTTMYGAFIDQRYIDYLHHNFDRIDQINWRKFEGLTCEFFERAGFSVLIGTGRNDGSIDARVWPLDASLTDPPLLLVQCKRQKSKVDRVVVKALYADVLHETAISGLIVTTSSLSPGAAADCIARGYPIRQADRASLAKWVTAMRTPYTGVFLGH